MSKFDFTSTIVTGTTVPEDIGTVDKLPFKALYTAMAEQMAADKKDSSENFIPQAFWTEERGVSAEKATPSYMKAKLRDQFNGWVKQDEEARSKYQLKTFARTGKEEAFKKLGAGISFWIIDKEA